MPVAPPVTSAHLPAWRLVAACCSAVIGGGAYPLPGRPARPVQALDRLELLDVELVLPPARRSLHREEVADRRDPDRERAEGVQLGGPPQVLVRRNPACL